MTEQRQIDVSELRDGDLIRVEWDYQGSATGIARRTLSGEWLLEVGTVWSLSIKTATITDVLRPVLVKGDRVEWVGASRKRKASTATVCQVNGDYVAVIRDDDVADKWPIEAVRRLPAVPEPAPIEVGDWWKSATGIVAVVLGVDGDTLTWRRLDGSLPLAGRTHVMAESWTRLDGPPEPPVGSVYVIGKTVWHHHAVGHLPALMGMDYPLSWPEVQDFFRSAQDRLATLQIVHTLEVE